MAICLIGHTVLSNVIRGRANRSYCGNLLGEKKLIIPMGLEYQTLLRHRTVGTAFVLGA